MSQLLYAFASKIADGSTFIPSPCIPCTRRDDDDDDDDDDGDGDGDGDDDDDDDDDTGHAIGMQSQTCLEM
eukprot:2360791-Amphidinium_carterae.1